MATKADAKMLAAQGAETPPPVERRKGLYRLTAAASAWIARSKLAVLFARNTVASFFAFAVDLLLLWIFVRFGGADPFAAAAIAFVLAISVHYALCRIWVFCGTQRGVAAGYVYFVINSGVGLAVTLGLFALLMEVAGLHYIVARTLASIVAGVAVFLLNAIYNFRSIEVRSKRAAKTK